MIGYQDFIPKLLQWPGLFSSGQGKYETFDEALAAANQWIADNAVAVLNVETVVLANVWNEEGTTDPAVLSNMATLWHQFIRVWYEAA